MPIAAVVEVIAEPVAPLVDDLEADAIALVVKIAGLRTAANMALDLSERRRGRALTVEEHAIKDMGRGVAVQHVDLENQTPQEALIAVGALTERLRPGVWDQIAKAIINAMAGQHDKIHARVVESVGSWRQFERDIREDSGAHFAGVK